MIRVVIIIQSAIVFSGHTRTLMLVSVLTKCSQFISRQRFFDIRYSFTLAALASLILLASLTHNFWRWDWFFIFDMF